VMKKSLQRHEQIKLLYMKNRAEEEERWKGAYRSKEPAPIMPMDLSQLVTDPRSFTAYSNVGRGYWNLGYRHRMFANG
jgi:hypothetical protein